MDQFETRSVTGLQVDGRTVSGLAIPYGKPSQVLSPGFIETIARGAAGEGIRTRKNIRALLEHDPSQPLAKTPKLKLTETDEGVRYQFSLPLTSAGNDALELIKDGTIQGASFRFSTPEDGDEWTRSGGTVHRTIKKMEISEISLVSDPAYLDTTASVRSYSAFIEGEQGRDAETIKRIIATFEW